MEKLKEIISEVLDQPKITFLKIVCFFIVANALMYFITSFLEWNLYWYKYIPANEDWRFGIFLFEIFLGVILLIIYEAYKKQPSENNKN